MEIFGEAVSRAAVGIRVRFWISINGKDFELGHQNLRNSDEISEWLQRYRSVFIVFAENYNAKGGDADS